VSDIGPGPSDAEVLRRVEEARLAEALELELAAFDLEPDDEEEGDVVVPSDAKFQAGLEEADPYDDQVVRAARELAREVAREEISSLCGLVMRRRQEGRSWDSIFAEAWRDFSQTADGPGDGGGEPAS
jgi:hypothetical protein